MNCQKTMYTTLRNLVKNESEREIVVVCIGTDRSTGDSLGPFVGSYLGESRLKKIQVYGTIHEPVHALNLVEKLKTIDEKHPEAFIIAVDACLGETQEIGKILIQEGPLRPGKAVGKDLPAVGDVSIKAIVNIGGYMSHAVLQNTRLSTTLTLARAIQQTLKQLDTYLKRKKPAAIKTLREVAVTKEF